MHKCFYLEKLFTLWLFIIYTLLTNFNRIHSYHLLLPAIYLNKLTKHTSYIYTVAGVYGYS